MNNFFEMKLKAISQNEKFARNVVASFAVSLNPTLSEIDDVKTAVSEAVTNCIVHGYNYDNDKYITLRCEIDNNKLVICIKDEGIGIPDIDLALTPFFTTREKEDRSGMGFTLMNSFMDNLEVKSVVGEGTEVIMTKEFRESEVASDAE